jgi:hypothetical protein
MSYEYVSRNKKDSKESARVLEELVRRGFNPISVRWKPETNSVVVYFEDTLDVETKEKLDKAMRALGYMVA